MKSSIIYFSISALALMASVVIVVCKKIPQEELHLLVTKGVAPMSLLRKSGPVRARGSDPETVLLAEAPMEVRTDEELQKVLSQLPVLKEIPWHPSEIADLYSNHQARPCRLLNPGVSTDAGFVGLEETAPAVGTSVSRFNTAFLIGLAIDAKGRAKLPFATKSTIENYLDEHMLAIQPEICRRADGQVFLTGQVRAMFFSKKSPSVSLAPEPMIQESISNLRVLGVLPGARPAPEPFGQVSLDESDLSLPRTLVMAFSYLRDRPLETSITLTAQPEYELIFLHLLPKSDMSGTPSLAVFATANGCTGFQELNLAAQDRRRTPAVQANIRFDKFKLFNQYPSDPIVTGLSNQIRSDLTVQEVQSRLAGRNGTPAVSLQQLLEELHDKPIVAGTTTFRK